MEAKVKTPKQIRRETLNWAVRETRTMILRRGLSLATWADHFAHASGCINAGITSADIQNEYIQKVLTRK